MEFITVCRGGALPFAYMDYAEKTFSVSRGKSGCSGRKIVAFQGLLIERSLMIRTCHLFTISTLFPLSTSLIYSRDVNSSSNRMGSLLLNLSFIGQLFTIEEPG